MSGYDVSAGLGDWTRRQLLDTPVQVLLSTRAAFVHADQRADLSQMAVPALVIQGRADLSTPVELTGRRPTPCSPRAAGRADGAGHGVYMSDPARYNAEILDFAATLAEPALHRERTRRGPPSAGLRNPHSALLDSCRNTDSASRRSS